MAAMIVQGRTATFALLGLTSSTIAVHFMSGDDRPLIAALRLVLATTVVGVVPGGLLVLGWRAPLSLGLLEWLAISIALSFGIVHLVTVGMIVAHGNVPLLSGALVLALGLCAAWLALSRRRPICQLSVSFEDVVGLTLLIVLGALLYLQGSPIGEWEDQIHISIVRRMAALPHITLDNFYLTPGVVYTYPFPSTHALMAFITRLSNLDALFVYHKLRFFWGPAALLMIYLGALAVFGRRGVAAASLLTATILTLTGMFAVVEGSYWGQLATHSHASDIAMAVLLPALLALSYRYIDSDAKQERPLLLTGVALLIFMLTVVHIREVVQYAAYLGCFLLVATLCIPFRRTLPRTLLLFGMTVVTVAVYVPWQSSLVGHITGLVDNERNRLLAILAATSARDLVLAPAWQLFPSFILWVDAAFHGLTQLLLLTAPLAIVVFRDRPLVWLIAASSLAYLIVMNVPVLAVSYILLTYHEILVTPIRNITPFLHLLAGPLLYAIASWLWTTIRPRAAAVVVIIAAGVTIGIVGYLAPLAANRSQLGFFVPAILAWGFAFLFLGLKGPIMEIGRQRVALAGAVAVVALVALWPDHPPPAPPPDVINVRWAEGVDDATRTALEERFSLAEMDRSPDPNTRVYQIADISVGNVQAIVRDPAVEDTHHIDRSTFAVEQPPRPWYRYPGPAVLAATAIGLWACAFLLPPLAARGIHLNREVVDRFLAAPFRRAAAPYGLVLMPVAAITMSPQLSPAFLEPIPRLGRVDTPSAIWQQMECVTQEEVSPKLAETYRGGELVPLIGVTSCPPSAEVAAWVEAHMPTEAVFAINRWNLFPPSVYLPQQVVTLSGSEFSLPMEDVLYPGYARAYSDSMRERGVQPFFNDQETTEQRRTFVRELGVTHVLVDPMYYDSMRRVLDALPQLFSLRYADGRWAITKSTETPSGMPLPNHYRPLRCRGRTIAVEARRARYSFS